MLFSNVELEPNPQLFGKSRKHEIDPLSFFFDILEATFNIF